MSDIYGILNVGRDALIAYQVAIGVTGHNIANADTPGYSRQRVNMVTNEPLISDPGQVGTGVTADEIQRIYDKFIGLQLNYESQNSGRWDARKSTLDRVEMIFDETSGYGLNQAMSEFWNAWQDLANNPSGQAERIALLGKSEIMAESFKKIHGDLERVQDEVDLRIGGAVEEINLIATQISDLNDKIAQLELVGQNANDHRDSRDLLLKELSLLIDFNSFEDSNGEVTVLISGGRPLVDNESSWSLDTETNAFGREDVVWTDGAGSSVNITESISGGKLKGWIEVRDEIISDYMVRLDDLAAGLINEVNGFHRNGYGLTTDPATSNPFTGFNFFTGSSASDIEVNSEIAEDVNKIAASETIAGVPGDNGNALLIANLQNGLTMSLGTLTFDDYYNSLVSDVGNEAYRASLSLEHQSDILTRLDNYREEISGVSIDEEMVNLIEFQHAYDAAAKLIGTVDELLETVINMV